jgi:hypothetical protein
MSGSVTREERAWRVYVELVRSMKAASYVAEAHEGAELGTHELSYEQFMSAAEGAFVAVDAFDSAVAADREDTKIPT